MNNPVTFQDLLPLRRMLEAILISSGNLAWIGSISYGRSKAGDPYYILYSANKRLNYKICRVYKEQFHKLPDYVQAIEIPDNVSNGNPTREDAEKFGLLVPCQLFKIATYDGQDTPMGAERRFYAVLSIAQE